MSRKSCTIRRKAQQHARKRGYGMVSDSGRRGVTYYSGAYQQEDVEAVTRPNESFRRWKRTTQHVRMASATVATGS